MRLEMVIQLAAATLFTGSFVAKTKQEGRRDGQKQERGKQRIIAILIFHHCGFCAFCCAKCGFANTHTKHTHTLTFWQHKLGSLSPSISKAPPCGDWLLFLAAWKKGKLCDVCFPLVLFGSSSVVGKVCMLCVSPVSSPGSRYCMLVRHLFGLFGRLTDVSVGCFFSSFNWKCSHLLQPSVYGKNKWKRKRRGKIFLVCCSRSVASFYNFMWHLCKDRLELEAVWSVMRFCSSKNNETTKYMWIHWQGRSKSVPVSMTSKRILTPSGELQQVTHSVTEEWYTEKKEERKNDWVACKRHKYLLMFHSMRTQL